MNMSHCRQAQIVGSCPTEVLRGSWMTARKRHLSLATVALVAALGCGGGGGNPAEQDAGFTTMGMPGVPSPTRVGANLVFADVAVNGKTGGRLGVDTGAPIMLVD